MNNQILPEQVRIEQLSFDTVEPLSNNYLNTLVVELDNDEIVGIILGGSYAALKGLSLSYLAFVVCFGQGWLG
jgi:hypothetical protein